MDKFSPGVGAFTLTLHEFTAGTNSDIGKQGELKSKYIYSILDMSFRRLDFICCYAAYVS